VLIDAIRNTENLVKSEDGKFECFVLFQCLA